MAKIVLLQVYYRKTDDEQEVMEQAPSGQDTVAIKYDFGQMVREVMASTQIKYWYGVVKVLRTDGKFAYRTIIPKQLVKQGR